jgi:hypothetical protein
MAKRLRSITIRSAHREMLLWIRVNDSALGFLVEPDASARLRGPRKFEVCFAERLEAPQNLGCHRRRAPRLPIYVQIDDLVGRRQVAPFLVPHPMEEVKALFIEVEQLGRIEDGIPNSQFAEVADVTFEREARDPVRLPVRFVEPHVVEPHVRRPVERDHVVAEIHVLIFVDPFGAHAVAALAEGSGHSVFHAPSPVLLGKDRFCRSLAPSLGRFAALVKVGLPHCREGHT